MNETIQTILSRRSVRSYEKRPVESEKITTIMECAQYAPSARNLQPWHFTVITNRALLDKISAANKKVMLASPDEMPRKMAADPNFDSFRGAPMAVIASGRSDAEYAMADCANAIENMALAACSLGLGSCYLGSFKICLESPAGAELLNELQIPDGYKPILALAIGYSSESLGERAARRENAITYFG